MCLVILTSPHPSAMVINQNANFYVMNYGLKDVHMLLNGVVDGDRGRVHCSETTYLPLSQRTAAV